MNAFQDAFVTNEKSSLQLGLNGGLKRDDNDGRVRVEMEGPMQRLRMGMVS